VTLPVLRVSRSSGQKRFHNFFSNLLPICHFTNPDEF
jgi:hypothetical protein